MKFSTAPSEVAVCIVAGGQATRLPGKLFLDAGGVPLLKRVFDNLSPIGEVIVATSFALREDVARLLPSTRLIVDKSAGEGPLRVIADAFTEISARWVFVVSGDAPFVDRSVFTKLARARQPDDGAVVPVHETEAIEASDIGRSRSEPLAALYRRDAALFAATETLRTGRRSMHALLEVLSVRSVDFAASHVFTNVNTEADYEAFRAAIT